MNRRELLERLRNSFLKGCRRELLERLEKTDEEVQDNLKTWLGHEDPFPKITRSPKRQRTNLSGIMHGVLKESDPFVRKTSRGQSCLRETAYGQRVRIPWNVS